MEPGQLRGGMRHRALWFPATIEGRGVVATKRWASSFASAQTAGAARESAQGAPMRLYVVQTGRLRDPHLIAVRDEFVKRFARFGRLTIVEAEPKGRGTLWPASARWRVALDERGEGCSSETLATRIAEWTMRHGEIAFLIGDAYGHHAPSLAEAQARLSLGPMTLPHQIAHLVLVEQLYRAATISAGTPYHHGG